MRPEFLNFVPRYDPSLQSTNSGCSLFLFNVEAIRIVYRYVYIVTTPLAAGIGVSSASVSVYIAEAVPAHMRGTCTVLNTVCLTGAQVRVRVCV